MIHNLKTWPEPFEALWIGAKRHEYRRDDRGFEIGDLLYLREWEPSLEDGDRYTGRVVVATVTYINRGPEWGIPEGFAVMSIDTVHRKAAA